MAQIQDIYTNMTQNSTIPSFGLLSKIKIGLSIMVLVVAGFISIYTIKSFFFKDLPVPASSAVQYVAEIQPKIPEPPVVLTNESPIDKPTDDKLNDTKPLDTPVILPASITVLSSELPKLAIKKRISVNLTDQKMYAMEDDQIVRESFITSGKDGYQTVTGDFAIYLKQQNTRLRSPFPELSYDFPVKYWMPFYSGYGIHDAYWRTEFGGQDYHWAGSHGCLNTPDDMVEFIWNWSEVGTPVHVE